MLTNAIRTVFMTVVCLLAVTALRAQTSGQIRGTVVDDDGKALDGVKVKRRPRPPPGLSRRARTASSASRFSRRAPTR